MNIKLGDGDFTIVNEQSNSIEKALASNPDIIVNEDDYQPTPEELIITEHGHQAELFRWAAAHEDEYPELRWMYAIPNGGMRHPAVGRMLQKEGVKPGVPDIHLPVPKGGYHGLWIELKKEGGTPSVYQLEWINALNEMGHKAVICWGWEQAREMIEKYLSDQVAVECYECGYEFKPLEDIYSITGSIEIFCEECHDKYCQECND